MPDPRVDSWRDVRSVSDDDLAHEVAVHEEVERLDGILELEDAVHDRVDLVALEKPIHGLEVRDLRIKSPIAVYTHSTREAA